MHYHDIHYHRSIYTESTLHVSTYKIYKPVV